MFTKNRFAHGHFTDTDTKLKLLTSKMKFEIMRIYFP